jgi:hypothetical protein
MLVSTVASFGAAGPGSADYKATTENAAGQGLALLFTTTAAQRLRSCAKEAWERGMDM